MNQFPEIKNPYIGIRPFQEEEDYLFFGREKQIAHLLESLEKKSFLAIIGISGCGKSSLVRAGLIPALKREPKNKAAKFILFRPGISLLTNLKKALFAVFNPVLTEEDISLNLQYSSRGILDCYEQYGSDMPFYMIVDQFEEIFRYKSLDRNNKEEALRFINLLLVAARDSKFPINIIITMRSDFIGNCAEFIGLPELINDHQYLVPRLTRKEFRDAIEKPARSMKVGIAPYLLSRLLNDIEDNPDQLPILQHAMMRTFDFWQKDLINRQESTLIEFSHYDHVGGMNLALSTHASEILRDLENKGLGQATKNIFQRITDQDVDGKRFRKPTKLKELVDVSHVNIESVYVILDAYRKERVNLIVPPVSEVLSLDTVVDISHESLIRLWNTLDTWVDEEVDNAKTYQLLNQSRTRRDKNEKDLLTGSELQNFINWRNRTKPTPDWAERYGEKGDFNKSILYLQESEDAKIRWDKIEKHKKIRQRIFRALFFLSIAVLVIYGKMRYDRNNNQIIREQGNLLTDNVIKANRLDAYGDIYLEYGKEMEAKNTYLSAFNTLSTAAAAYKEAVKTRSDTVKMNEIAKKMDEINSKLNSLKKLDK